MKTKNKNLFWIIEKMKRSITTTDGKRAANELFKQLKKCAIVPLGSTYKQYDLIFNPALNMYYYILEPIVKLTVLTDNIKVVKEEYFVSVYDSRGIILESEAYKVIPEELETVRHSLFEEEVILNIKQIERKSEL